MKGGCVEAPYNLMIFSCSTLDDCLSSLKKAEWSCSVWNIFIATSIPRHLPLMTRPKLPFPKIWKTCIIFNAVPWLYYLIKESIVYKALLEFPRILDLFQLVVCDKMSMHSIQIFMDCHLINAILRLIVLTYLSTIDFLFNFLVVNRFDLWKSRRFSGAFSHF